MDILAVLVDGIVSAKKCILISPVTFAVKCNPNAYI